MDDFIEAQNKSPDPLEITVGWSGEIHGVSHIAIFLVVFLGEILDEVIMGSMFVSCRAPEGILDEISGGIPDKIPGASRGRIPEEIFVIIPVHISKWLFGDVFV